MSEIKTFPFNAKGFSEFKELPHGHNWPVVYLIEDGKEIYIGETTNIHHRSNEHYKKEERRKLSKIHIVIDDEYNKSATLDTEANLIQYMLADEEFILQNKNNGLSSHNYYDKQNYTAKFERLWEKLQKKGLAKQDLLQLRNTDLFKYSPYKSLTEDQLDIAVDLTDRIIKKLNKTFLIHGKPGTGKTILAVYLFKCLSDNELTKHLKIGLVVPMTPLRKTIKKVFSKIKGFKSSMVIGPSDVVNNQYDVLIVDEAHRLRQRKNITNYRRHDNINKELGFGKEGTELDWILASSQHQILFYDPNQSIRPSDVNHGRFNELSPLTYQLETQVRVLGGEEYINFIDRLFETKKLPKKNFKKYDFKIYSNLEQMLVDIKKKDKQHGLARVVAGYAWPWLSKKDRKLYDIKLDGVQLRWNSTMQDWVNSKNAINEVGCIHTVQGYDLNYVGVIIGPELSYDFGKKKFFIKKENYYDTNGWKGIEDPKELERYIINIYKTLLTRGIKGVYIYAVDKNVYAFLKSLK